MRFNTISLFKLTHLYYVLDAAYEERGRPVAGLGDLAVVARLLQELGGVDGVGRLRPSRVTELRQFHDAGLQAERRGTIYQWA